MKISRNVGKSSNKRRERALSITNDRIGSSSPTILKFKQSIMNKPEPKFISAFSAFENRRLTTEEAPWHEQLRDIDESLDLNISNI